MSKDESQQHNTLIYNLKVLVDNFNIVKNEVKAFKTK